MCKKHGGTLLHWAKNKHVIDWLLTIQGPDINARSRTGDTALNIMVQRNRPPCVLELIRAGADVNIPDNDGNTPLHHAVEVSINNDGGVHNFGDLGNLVGVALSLFAVYIFVFVLEEFKCKN